MDRGAIVHGVAKIQTGQSTHAVYRMQERERERER